MPPHAFRRPPMADTRIPPPHTPGNWGEAFAALPAETPPRDGWRRVARQLDTRRRARRLPAWAGIAVAAGLLLVVGLWSGLQPTAPAPASPVAPPGQRLALQPARPVTTPGATPHPAAGAIDGDTVASPATRPPETTPRVATAPDPSPDPATAIAPATESALVPLQQESAHLETLLALARDDSVRSAGAVLLADAFDTRLAEIDALLANPGLAAGERESLWRARVDALRQAAGFVSTQRLLAVQGHGDAWLASVD